MQKNNILFVDDEPKVLSAIERALGIKAGYSLSFAESGKEALEMLKSEPCKVLVSDVKMPHFNGLDFLVKVKELYPDIIRVVLSGHNDVQLVLEAVNKRSIDRYLTKPWDVEDLKATLSQCIELYDLRNEVKELRQQLSEQK